MTPVHLLRLMRLPILWGGLAAATLVLVPGDAAAQSEGEYGGYDGDRDNPGDVTVTGTVGANRWGIASAFRAAPGPTAAVTTAIRDSYGFCASVGAGYLVDCLGEQLESISSSVSKSGDYGAAREILAEAATDLRAIAAANRAPAQPRVRARGQVGGREIETGPLTPVRPERVAAVNQAAAAVLQEAETKLLRSAEASDRRLIAYAEMAKAVGSNKTLLRSA
jgi:hypothetical protein